MNSEMQNTAEIRELTVAELDEVAGGNVALAVSGGPIVGAVMQVVKWVVDLVNPPIRIRSGYGDGVAPL